MITTKQIEQDAKWEAEDDLRTLKRAIEVVNDSKRYKAAMKEAGEEKKQLEKVSSLRSKLTLTK